MYSCSCARVDEYSRGSVTSSPSTSYYIVCADGARMACMCLCVCVCERDRKGCWIDPRASCMLHSCAGGCREGIPRGSDTVFGPSELSGLLGRGKEKREQVDIENDANFEI